MVDLGMFDEREEQSNIFSKLTLNKQAYSPETGGRSFEDNQSFFEDAKEHDTWRVQKVNKGEFGHMPRGEKESGDGESTPLLGNSS